MNYTNWQMIMISQQSPKKKVTFCRGWCNPVKWLNESWKNLTVEYLNLNFVTTPKLTPLHSFFAEKVFISCVWVTPVLLVRTMDSVPRTSFFDTDILQHILSDLKFSRLVIVDILVGKEKCSVWENTNEVIEDLGTGSFVTVTNLASHSCGCEEIFPRKFLLITCRVWRGQFDATCKSQVRKRLVSLGILAKIMKWRFSL